MNTQNERRVVSWVVIYSMLLQIFHKINVHDKIIVQKFSRHQSTLGMKGSIVLVDSSYHLRKLLKQKQGG